MVKKEKIFVLDTNVILHDSSSIHQFDEHSVAVPITVLEELDQFKKGNDSLNFHAREFMRRVDALSEDKLFEDGVKVNAQNGRLLVCLEREMHKDLMPSFIRQKPDHQILNIAYSLAQDHPRKEVVLVTKDVNLRMKAKSIGLLAQDYKTDHVPDISTLYSGMRVMEGIPSELIKSMYSEPYEFT
ncbi:MAG: ribonuclease, partial [Chitinivibrionales bacterium]|nr:ribonuclease [Chitinivibrionales bacterium]